MPTLSGDPPRSSAVEAVVDRAVDDAERINHLFARIAPEELGARAAALAEAALAGGVWTEIDGARAPIRVALRPRTLDLTCRGYVHHVTWQIRMGLRRLARITAADPRAAALLPLTPVEAEWIARYQRPDGGPGPGERVFCRLDALARFDGPGWRSTLHFVEPNVVGIGGMSYAPAAERALLDHVVPALQALDPDLTLEPNHDPRDLLLDDLQEHARALGCAAARPTIAFVDDASLYTLGGEFGRLVPHFQGLGVDAIYVDPRALELGADGRVVADGRPVDVIYRFLEIGELAAMEAEGADLRALHAAFAAGIVVPSAAGDLEHKSAFEILTSEAFAGAFTDEQRAVYREHVLWTRLLGERRTTGPEGQVIDLVEFARGGREALVLKPNRAYGGLGVVIGATVDAPAWEAALDAALAAPGTHVVQRLSPPDRERFPHLTPAGALAFTDHFSAVGFFPGRRGLGVFGRHAPGEVVNINAGGGVVGFLVSVA